MAIFEPDGDGVISADEHQGWIDALHAEQAAERFLGGQTHLFVLGMGPESR